MRWIFLGIFVFFFVIVPMHYLVSFVVPELQSIEQVYANAGATASNIANQSYQGSQ